MNKPKTRRPKKRALSPAEEIELVSHMQHATLARLAANASRHMRNIYHQGGAALHFAFGSERFSRDLDFTMDESIDRASLFRGVADDLESIYRRALHPEAKIEMTHKTTGSGVEATQIKLSAPIFTRKYTVKVELWPRPAEHVRAADSLGARYPSATYRMPGVERDVRVGEFRLNTASEHTLLTDKWFALGTRRYLKFRDLYDLEYLEHHRGVRISNEELMDNLLNIELNLYPPRDQTREQALAAIVDRWAEVAEILRTPDTAERMRQDLFGLLPPDAAQTLAAPEAIQQLIDASLERIEARTAAFRTLMAELDAEEPSPAMDVAP